MLYHIIFYKFNELQRGSARFYQTTRRHIAKGSAFQIMSSLLTQIESTQFRIVTRSWVKYSILYALSLTVTALTLTEWVGFRISGLTLRGKHGMSPQRYKSVTASDVQLTRSLKSYLCTVLTRSFRIRK
jgi:hypothetical protein